MCAHKIKCRLMCLKNMHTKSQPISAHKKKRTKKIGRVSWHNWMKLAINWTFWLDFSFLFSHGNYLNNIIENVFCRKSNSTKERKTLNIKIVKFKESSGAVLCCGNRYATTVWKYWKNVDSEIENRIPRFYITCEIRLFQLPYSY